MSKTVKLTPSLDRHGQLGNNPPPLPPPDLFDDYVDVPTLATKVDRCARTITRWMDEPGGLPFTMLGNRRLIHVPTAREWLMRRMKNVRRERPRPRKR